ncbi:MAG TPA: zinc ribbon domain-containing protein [Methylomirabilota bacterium]|nr:zinc ribbon domain-containing protein [Methylomirabilota bacterium]
MPIYEYRCRACGRAFERLVQGDQPVACPECASGEVTRLLSLFGFRSTGGGLVASAGGAGGCGCGRGGCGCH